jgi:hypothetical protein
MSENITSDRTGMPLIWIPSIQSHVGFFPVSKVSFEYFLCDRTAAQAFDNAWYTKILEANERIPVGEVRSDNFEKALITGVTPDEIGRYSRWLGQNKQNVRLPTNEEWSAIYEYASSRPPLSSQELCSATDHTERVPTLIRNLTEASDPKTPARSMFGGQMTTSAVAATLARQMLLSQGIGEWVIGQANGSTHCGARGGILRRLDGDGMDPANPRLLFKDRFDTRPRFVGFRLIFTSRS